MPLIYPHLTACAHYTQEDFTDTRPHQIPPSGRRNKGTAPTDLISTFTLSLSKPVPLRTAHLPYPYDSIYNSSHVGHAAQYI